MFRYASKTLKRNCPGAHELLKRAYFRTRLPALKFLDGRPALVAPQLINAFPTESHVLRWIRASLRRGNIFFDVGAHHGWMSITACRRVGATGKVVAFEASPLLIEILQYNKKANRLRQMEIVAQAVADATCQTATFYLQNNGSSSLNSLVDHPVGARQIPPGPKSTMQVRTISLDDYCEKTDLQPDAVKIDIEGAELLALRGCTRILKERHATFIVAIHPTWLPEGQNAAQVFDLFCLNGYKVADSQIVEYEGADFGDYLFVPDVDQISRPQF